LFIINYFKLQNGTDINIFLIPENGKFEI